MPASAPAQSAMATQANTQHHERLSGERAARSGMAYYLPRQILKFNATASAAHAPVTAPRSGRAAIEDTHE